MKKSKMIEIGMGVLAVLVKGETSLGIGYLKGTRPMDLTLSRFFQGLLLNQSPNEKVKDDWEWNGDFGPWGKLALGETSLDIEHLKGTRPKDLTLSGYFHGLLHHQPPIKWPKLIRYEETFLGIWRASGR